MIDSPPPSDTYANVINRWGHGLTWFLVLAIFWPAIFGSSVLGFGDAASLYQPLFEWIRQQWLKGEIPLWCDLDNWGGPVVADAASGVFYPLKAIFLLPFVPFAVLFNLFTLVHVLLAVYGARWCALSARLSIAAAWWVGISYGFGGCVLFQSSNTVFLIGAAWLPIALGWIIKYSQDRKPAFLFALSSVLGMLILGGDPQMAFHCLIISGIGWWIATPHDQTKNNWLSRMLAALCPMIVILIMSFLLSAVQILPSMEWSQKSERSSYENNRSVYRILNTPNNPVDTNPAESNFDYQPWVRPLSGTHQDAIYQFSQPPWSLTQMIWPNLFGKQHPWGQRLPGADRVWHGSIYFGVLTFLFALLQITSPGSRHRERFLIATLLVFLIGSLGWYGLGWWIHELNLMQGGNGTAHFFGEPTGGIYWFMEVFIPGYYRFRYPAKLLVIAAFCFSLLAGKTFDALFTSKQKSLPRSKLLQQFDFWTKVTLILTLLLLLITALNRLTGHQLFWILDADASTQIAGSLLHATAVLVICQILVKLSRQQRLKDQSTVVLLLTLLTLDVGTANAWTVQLCEPPAMGASVEADEPRFTSLRSESIDSQTAELDDLNEQLTRDRESLYPKLHLLSGQRVIGSFNSILPLDIAAAIYGNDLSAIAKSLGIDSQITSKFQRRTLGPQRRFFFPNEVLLWEPIDEGSLIAVHERTRAVFSSLAAVASKPDVERAIVEDLNERLPADGPPIDSAPKFEILSDSHSYKQFQVSLNHPRLVVLSEYFDDNWDAYQILNGRRILLPKARVNRVLTGISLPAGDYEMAYTYFPKQFFVGLGISFLTWGLLGVYWIRSSWNRPI